VYPGDSLFVLGQAKIGKELTKIRESLIAEKNLVEDDNEETFHEQIQRSISDKMIKALN